MSINFLAYFNPFDTRFDAAEKFGDLEKKQKIAVLACTLLGGLFFFGIGGVAAFRYSISKFHVTRELSEHANETARKAASIHRDALQSRHTYTSPSHPTVSGTINNAKGDSNATLKESDSATEQRQDSATIFENKETLSLNKSSRGDDSVSAEYDFDTDDSDFEDDSQIGPSEEDIIYTVDGREIHLYTDKLEVPSNPYTEHTAATKNSLEKQKSLELLSSQLDKIGLYAGEAQDNGDCFYDSIAQIFSRYSKSPISASAVRQLIKSYIDQLPEKENWVRQKKQDSIMDPYDTFAAWVGHTFDDLKKEYSQRLPTLQGLAKKINGLRENAQTLYQESVQKDDTDLQTLIEAIAQRSQEYEQLSAMPPAPIWGSNIDCEILSRIFGVKIVVHEIYSHDVGGEKAAQEMLKDGRERKEPIQLQSGHYKVLEYIVQEFEKPTTKEPVDTESLRKQLTISLPQEIHIANYRSHFIPCFSKKK